jgi:hypothetical protein
MLVASINIISTIGNPGNDILAFIFSTSLGSGNGKPKMDLVARVRVMR